MRVMHVISQMGLGGAERALLAIIRGLRDRCEQRLCVLRGENTYPAEFPCAPHMLRGPGSQRNVIAQVGLISRLRRQITDFKPTLVHSHLWPAAHTTSIALAGSGIPHVVHVQDTRPWLAGSTIRDRLMRALNRATLAITNPEYVAVSTRTMEYNARHLGIELNKFHVVYNGCDAAFLQHSSQSQDDGNRTVVIGTAGRFSPEKGHEILLNAVAILARKGTDIKLRIVGGGSLRERYLQFVDREELNHVVEIGSVTHDMLNFYRSLDVFVLPSLGCEGLPLTILEAMGSALPVIATDVAGSAEVIRDGVDGLIVAPGDALALADAIGSLCADSTLRQAMGKKAAQRVSENFTDRAMVDGVYAVYTRILQQRGTKIKDECLPGKRSIAHN